VKQPAVARKYALALFHAAQAKAQLDAVEADLASVRQLLEKDRRVAGLLGAPEITEDKKRAFLQSVLGGRVQPLTLEFLDLLLEKGRFAIFSAAVDGFQELAMEARHIIRVRATTAVRMDDPARAKLVQQLQKLTGKTVQMTEAVDPRILGGVVVQVGGKIIDGSVRSALSELRDTLLAAPLQAGAP